MSKIYSLFLLLCCSLFVSAQQTCPVINVALANSCAPNGPTEGANEFIAFTTGVSATVGSYQLNYGSNYPPSQAATGILSGTNATTKTGTGSIIVQGGCVLHELTSSTDIIPADSRVVFIPSVFDVPYDLSGLCKNGNLYVVYIDRASLPSKWGLNGTLANSPSGARYIQVEYSGDACLDNVRTYSDEWELSGSAGDGNAISWDDNNSIYYLNTGCSVIIIPVKIVSFTATQKEKNVVVNWQTTNEINTKSFEVMVSSDGINFTTIGTVNAKGNAASISSYSFVDYNATGAIKYYRIKMIDIDGTEAYTSIVKVLNIGKDSFAKVYTDLGGSKLNIELNANASNLTNAVIFDYTGRMLTKEQLAVNSGYNHFQLDINKLPAGGYLLKLSGNDQTNIIKFVKP